MGVVNQMSLTDQLSHFILGQAPASFDGSPAGHGLQHAVKKITPRAPAIGLLELFHEVFEDPDDVTARNQDW